MILAVAGAIKIKSALLAKAMCSTFQFVTFSHMLTTTGLQLNSLSVKGVMKLVAASVIMTLTLALLLRSLLTISAAL